jgi:hypothetical protein
MMVDNALANPQVILESCGDERIGKGRTQKFQQSEFTRLIEAGQSQAWYGQRLRNRSVAIQRQV